MVLELKGEWNEKEGIQRVLQLLCSQESPWPIHANTWAEPFLKISPNVWISLIAWSHDALFVNYSELKKLKVVSSKTSLSNTIVGGNYKPKPIILTSIRRRFWGRFGDQLARWHLNFRLASRRGPQRDQLVVELALCTGSCTAVWRLTILMRA